MIDEITSKIQPIPRPNSHVRLVDHLERALDEAQEVGDDIADAILKLIASAKRRELEARLSSLPDITNDAEAA